MLYKHFTEKLLGLQGLNIKNRLPLVVLPACDSLVKMSIFYNVLYRILSENSVVCFADRIFFIKFHNKASVYFF